MFKIAWREECGVWRGVGVLVDLQIVYTSKDGASEVKRILKSPLKFIENVLRR